MQHIYIWPKSLLIDINVNINKENYYYTIMTYKINYQKPMDISKLIKLERKCTSIYRYRRNKIIKARHTMTCNFT